MVNQNQLNKILKNSRCEEADSLSRETFIPCGKEVCFAIYLSGDKRIYFMCDFCGNHNIKNRGGIIVAKLEE